MLKIFLLFRYFWISWYGCKIKVGTGVTGPNQQDSVLLESEEYNLRVIQSMAVSTGWGSTGVWKIFNPTGKLFSYLRPCTQLLTVKLHLYYQVVWQIINQTNSMFMKAIIEPMFIVQSSKFID